MNRYSPNPFYVQPGGDISDGLTGLGQILAENRRAKEEKEKAEAEAQRQAEARQAAIDAVRSGDPMRVAEVSLQYPDLSENIANQTGMIDKRRREEGFQHMAGFINAPDDAQREALVMQRAEALRNQGRDPSHTLQSWQDYQANPEKELKAMNVLAAMQYPDRYKAMQEAMRVDAPEVREFTEGDRTVTKQWDSQAGAWNTVADAPRSVSNKLVKVADPSSPSGVKYVPESQAAGMPAYQSGGMQLQTNPDGSVSFSMGGQPNQLGTKGRNDVETKLVNTTESLSRLNSISNSLKPEALTFQGRMNEQWLSFKDKFANGSMSDEERQKLTEFSEFKQNSINNLNMTLNELSGAAVSPEEGKRIASGLPDPGVNVFDGDSPTEFTAKLQNSTRLAKQAIIRYNYALRQGLDPLNTGIDLADVDQLIDKRGGEIEKMLAEQYPEASQEDIEAMTEQQIRQEFGL
jgi:hypothetical protein